MNIVFICNTCQRTHIIDEDSVDDSYNCSTCGMENLEVLFYLNFQEVQRFLLGEIGELDDFQIDVDNVDETHTEFEQINMDDIPLVEVDKSHVYRELECVICITNYELNDKVRKIHCGHMFHEECLRDWLKEHHTCPLCRANIVSNDTSYRWWWRSTRCWWRSTRW